MNIRIDFGRPFFDRQELSALTASELNDYYASASDLDRTNLFFVLLNSMHRFEAEGMREETAHLCFLMAYYLFVPLTPPASASLALHYIQKATHMDPKPEYREWLELIRKGN